MRYRLCNNGKGVLITREASILGGALVLEFDSIDNGYTVVIKNGEHVFYRSVKDGSCELEASKISGGVLQLSVIKNDEVNPTWTLDELYAVRKGNVVAISGNTLEYDKLLAEQRAEMDELRADMLVFKAELEQFRKEFNAVYKGYEII